MERAWMVEKDRLLREMDLIRQQANISLKESMMNTSLGSHGGKVDPDEVKVDLDFSKIFSGFKYGDDRGYFGTVRKKETSKK